MNSFAYLVDMVAFFLLWYELTNRPYTFNSEQYINYSFIKLSDLKKGKKLTKKIASASECCLTSREGRNSRKWIL